MISRRTCLVVLGAVVALPVALPLHAQSHRISFTLHNNAIYIIATIDGKPASLKLDTAATASTFSAKFLTVYRKQSLIHTAGGDIMAGIGDASLELGDMKFQLTATYLPSNQIGDGVIGMDVLRQFQTITVDFKNHQIELIPFH